MRLWHFMAVLCVDATLQRYSNRVFLNNFGKRRNEKRSVLCWEKAQAQSVRVVSVWVWVGCLNFCCGQNFRCVCVAAIVFERIVTRKRPK